MHPLQIPNFVSREGAIKFAGLVGETVAQYVFAFLNADADPKADRDEHPAWGRVAWSGAPVLADPETGEPRQTVFARFVADHGWIPGEALYLWAGARGWLGGDIIPPFADLPESTRAGYEAFVFHAQSAYNFVMLMVNAKALEAPPAAAQHTPVTQTIFETGDEEGPMEQMGPGVPVYDHVVDDHLVDSLRYAMAAVTQPSDAPPEQPLTAAEAAQDDASPLDHLADAGDKPASAPSKTRRKRS